MPEFSTDNQPTSEAKRRGWTFRHTMERILADPDMPVGTNDRVPLHERVVRAHIKKAMRGDMPAVKELYDRVDGKVKDVTELTGKDGAPVSIDLNDTTTVERVVKAMALLVAKAKAAKSE